MDENLTSDVGLDHAVVKPMGTSIMHTDDLRICSPVEGTDVWVYWIDGTRYECDRSHDLIVLPKEAAVPEPEPAKTTYDDLTLGEVLDGERVHSWDAVPVTARGILLARLARNLDEQAEMRRQADASRQRAEESEEKAEALEPVIRELEDAVRVLTPPDD